MPPMQVILSLIGIIIVIIAAYYATYYIGLKASGQNRGKNRGRNKNIIVRERFAISKDKSFCIVEIAGKIYVVGVTNQSMALLDTYDAAEFAKNEAENTDAAVWGAPPGGPFSGKYVNKLSSFMARRMGKSLGTGVSADMRNGSFADNMKSAQDRSVSGQPDKKKADQPDDSNGSEDS